MRAIYKQLKTIGLLTFLLLATGIQANATTYTALFSGNFSSSGTWQGGAIPANIQSGDEIHILSGVTVNMDQDLVLQTGNTLNVVGTLNGASGKYLSIGTGAIVKGTGNITVDSVATDFTSGFTFTGLLTADAFYSANAMVNSLANITVNKTLYLAGGTTTMAAGMMDLQSNAMIVVDGGVITVTGGTINLTDKYDVMYKGSSSATAGLELNGSGLNDIYINTANGTDVSLSGDLVANGTLSLTNGSLNLNGNNLTIGANGDVVTSAGTIKTSSTSDITINAAGSLTGSLNFESGSNTVDDFTINLGDNKAMVMIDGDLMVNGQLDLQSGKLHIGNNKIELMTNATLTGGSENSYIVTAIGGRLVAGVSANNSQKFHVGTEQHYAPAIVTGNGTSASSMFSVGVDGTVLESGTSGTDISMTQPMVNATWFIESSATANVDVDLEVMWDAAMEVNSFNRMKAYIAHYTNAKWEADAAVAANMSGSGMYSIKRTGLKSFSPFAVFDESTPASVNNINIAADVEVYPNPATSVINISANDNAQPIQAGIYNLSGQLMQSTIISNNTQNVNISSLPAGTYYVRLQGDNAAAAQTFIKQ